MLIVILAALVLVLLGVVIWLLNKPGNLHTAQLRDYELKLARADERAKHLDAELNRQYALVSSLQAAITTEKTRYATIAETLQSARERLAEQEKYLHEVQKNFKAEFENLANKLLDEKSARMTEHNRTSIDVILNPLKEKIQAFEQKVDAVYKTEAGERNMLKGAIEQLMELNRQISTEAHNLTHALKGDSKKQGNWGEMILERVLESSGLEKNREYRIQHSLQNTDGNRLQPDVVVYLPDNKHLVIDAKVSLVAYERLVNSQTDEERAVNARAHVDSVRNHIAQLSAKRYHDLQGIHTPDFVLLFMPLESSFAMAVQLDADLFTYAWDKKVVIVSASTLLATLRTIASIWKQEHQNRNVLEIARLSGEMYDKFVGFLADMDMVDKGIKNSQKSYDEAIKKLGQGRGNLITTAEKVKKLGARADKQIDQKWLLQTDALNDGTDLE